MVIYLYYWTVDCKFILSFHEKTILLTTYEANSKRTFIFVLDCVYVCDASDLTVTLDFYFLIHY